jgi:hypothetical protein
MMQPVRRARERGSPVRAGRHPGHPSLSADRLARHFFVDDWVENDLGAEEEYTWKPHQVRFVLWYHLTTYIPNDAIAAAFNVTFGADGGGAPEMKAVNVQEIIDVIKNRMKLIEDDIAERDLGRWPRPSEVGWIPCDHGMSCTTLSQASNGTMTSVMKSAEVRTRGAAEMAAMATGLWEGTWEDILQCPRGHKEAFPAITTPAYPPPTIGAFQRIPRPGERERKPVEAGTIPGRSSNQTDPSFRVNPAKELRSSPRKSSANPPSTQRNNLTGSAYTKVPTSSPSKDKHSPTKQFHCSPSRVHAMAAVEEESDVDWADPAPARPVRAATRSLSNGLASGRSVYQTASVGSLRTRAPVTGSSLATGTSRLSVDSMAAANLGRSAASQQAVVPIARASTQVIAPRRRGVVQAVLEFFGRSDVLWFVVQQIIRGICLCIILEPCFELLEGNTEDLPHYLMQQNWRSVLYIGGTILFAREVIGYASGSVRDYAWRHWRVVLSPPEAPHLSTTAYFVWICIASAVASLAWPRWAHHTRYLLQRIAQQLTAQEAAMVEVLGSDEPI